MGPPLHSTVYIVNLRPEAHACKGACAGVGVGMALPGKTWCVSQSRCMFVLAGQEVLGEIYGWQCCTTLVGVWPQGCEEQFTVHAECVRCNMEMCAESESNAGKYRGREPRTPALPLTRRVTLGESPILNFLNSDMRTTKSTFPDCHKPEKGNRIYKGVRVVAHAQRDSEVGSCVHARGRASVGCRGKREHHGRACVPECEKPRRGPRPTVCVKAKLCRCAGILLYFSREALVQTGARGHRAPPTPQGSGSK